MTEYTILGNQTPALIDSDDGAGGVVLGVKFRTNADGWITRVRFWKAWFNTGTHIGYLWNADTATLISSVVFTNESDSGWQEQEFATPIPVTSGVKYLVSYFAPVGHYSATTQFFGDTYYSLPLETIPNSVEPNGVYHYTNGGDSEVIPAGTFNAANYWVDVVFADSIASDPTVSFKSRESGVWVSRTAVPKVRQSGAWVNAQPKRRAGTDWVELT